MRHRDRSPDRGTYRSISSGLRPDPQRPLTTDHDLSVATHVFFLHGAVYAWYWNDDLDIQSSTIQTQVANVLLWPLLFGGTPPNAANNFG